jgi:hypothetical protein
MDYKLIRILRLENEQRQKDNKFLKEMQEAGGMQISDFRNHIQALDIDNKEKMTHLANEQDFRKSGLVQSDIPMEFKVFKDTALSQQKYPIRKQLWTAMNENQRATYLSSTHPALYNDSHLEKLNEKQIHNQLEKTMVDIEANRENLKPFYPDSSPMSVYHQKKERVD